MRRREFMAGTAGLALVGSLQRRAAPTASPRRVTRLDDDWRFHLGDVDGGERPDFDDRAWEAVSLPHTARLEALVTGPPGSPTAQWQGDCWYRRTIRREDGAPPTCILRFDGAMNVADVFLDGERVGQHLGGFLPFAWDLTDWLVPGRDHLLAVRLDNHDNPITGPKPLAQLDFNTYGGLYRSVWLEERDHLHIGDPLLTRTPAGGGVRVRWLAVSPTLAHGRVSVEVRNGRPAAQAVSVRIALRDADGRVVAAGTTPPESILAHASSDVHVEFRVHDPRLWSPAAPHLHRLDCELLDGDGVADLESLSVGIRAFALRDGKLHLNGEPLVLRGANRHQEHPWVGYALPDAAQWRDARRIKDAGFDYVRLSHYPHAPAFMDACDALGLVTMNCIPGWQYYNPDPAFVALQERNARALIRRDRNRASVALWEVSLNESPMPPGFIARMNAIAKEELPGCLTAGWMPGYDVLLDARQHGGCRHAEERACLVSEYGDWEYYAMNAGLAQDAWQDLSPAESNSRQFRWQGERAMLQQAANFQEAHNDNLATGAIGDGLWVMYDYNRGYAPDIESSGCADIFRLPKYAWHFFRSQRDAAARIPGAATGPMVFIASDWVAGSSPEVRVFSNCDEVALSLDGRVIARQGPDTGRTSSHLAHPPFTFRTGGFRAGRLEAVGLIGGRRVARHAVETAGPPVRLAVAVDLAGRPRDRALGDLLFVRAMLLDARGNLVTAGFENVAFGTSGPGRLIGDVPFATEAGIASALVATPPGRTRTGVHAVAIVAAGDRMRVLTGSASTDGPDGLATWAVATDDGSAPTPTSRRVTAPVAASDALRAAVVTRDRVLAAIAAAAPKWRMPASAPPERRDPFRP